AELVGVERAARGDERLLERADLRVAVDHREIGLARGERGLAALVLEVLARLEVVRRRFALARAERAALVERKGELEADLPGGGVAADGDRDRARIARRTEAADEIEGRPLRAAGTLRLELRHFGGGLLREHRVGLLLGNIHPRLHVVRVRRRQADIAAQGLKLRVFLAADGLQRAPFALQVV